MHQMWKNAASILKFLELVVTFRWMEKDLNVKLQKWRSRHNGGEDLHCGHERENAGVVS